MNSSMYALLAAKLNRPTAAVLTILWFTILLVAIGYFAFEPQAELKYLAL